jgi:hypothetical protein
MGVFRRTQVARQFQTPIRFRAVKRDKIMKEAAEKKNTYSNEIDVRKPLVVSILQISEN